MKKIMYGTPPSTMETEDSLVKEPGFNISVRLLVKESRFIDLLLISMPEHVPPNRKFGKKYRGFRAPIAPGKSPNIQKTSPPCACELLIVSAVCEVMKPSDLCDKLLVFVRVYSAPTAFFLKLK